MTAPRTPRKPREWWIPLNPRTPHQVAAVCSDWLTAAGEAYGRQQVIHVREVLPHTEKGKR